MDEQQQSTPEPVIEPVIDLVIRLDTRTGGVGVYAIGAKLNPDVVYKMLELAREWMRQVELRAARNQEMQTPGEPGA